MIRSLLLFTHITGMLALFGGLAVETATAKPLQRLYGIAFALLLFSGVWLAAREGVHMFAWVRVSFLTMIAMAIAGARFRAATLYPRIALALGVVFLMISKVGLRASLVVTLISLVAGLVANVIRPRAAATTRSSSGAPTWSI